MIKIRSSLARRAFSKQPVEHTVNEAEFEAQIKDAQASIQDKLKKIKAQQQQEAAQG